MVNDDTKPVHHSFEIIPHVGVGPIRFGMTRDEVRALFTAPLIEFEPSDHYRSLGLRVDYTPALICEAVGVSDPGVAVFEGRAILSEPAPSIRQWLTGLDPEAEISGEGLISQRLGLLVAFCEDWPETPPVGVVAFCGSFREETFGQ